MKRLFTAWTCVLACTLAFSLFSSNVWGEELSLNQAVSFALQHNLDVMNAALDISKAKDRSSAFRSTFFPKFSIYALGSQQLVPITVTIPEGTLGKYPIIGNLPGKDVPYTTPAVPTGFILTRVAQPLSGLYRTKLNSHVLNYSELLAQQKLRAKRQDIVRDVKQTYYGIEQVESSRQVIGETVTLYKEVERLTNDYVLKQTALEADLLQSQAALADAQQSDLSLANQEAKLKEQLNDFLGRDVLIEFDVVPMNEEIASYKVDLPATRQKALAHRPEVEQARLKVLQSQEELRAKKADYIPDVSAEFNSFTLLNYNAFLPTGSYSIGLSLTWEPFDWGRKKNEMAEKRDTISQDKNTQTSTERKVIMDVDDKYRQIQQASSKLNTAQVTQRAAAESLRVDKNQYEVQSALLKVVLQAEATLAQANSDYLHAMADYWAARADFDHAIGEDQ
jgi:outer membrane protein TolC